MDWPLHKGTECAILKSATSKSKEIPTAVLLSARILRVISSFEEEEVEGTTKGSSAATLLATTEGPLDAARCAALDQSAGVFALPIHHSTNSSSNTNEDDEKAMAPMVNALSNGSDGAIDILSRLRTGAFTLSDGESRPWGIGLFPRAALLNHDCESNCVASFVKGKEGQRPKICVRTIRAIRKDEELTLTYVDVGMPTIHRRAALQKGYGFHCMCARCSASDDVKNRFQMSLLGTKQQQQDEEYFSSFSSHDVLISRIQCATCQGSHMTSIVDHKDVESNNSGASGVSKFSVYASPCSSCGILASPATGDALYDALCASYESALLLRSGDAPQALSRAAGALSKLSSHRLTPEHWLLGTLASCAAHAAIAVNQWEVAINANHIALLSLTASLPSLSIPLALQRAQQAKLLLVDNAGGTLIATQALNLATIARSVIITAYGDDDLISREIIATCENAQIARGGGRDEWGRLT